MNKPIYSYCYIAFSPTPTDRPTYVRSLSRKSSQSRPTLQRANQIKPTVINIPKSPKNPKQRTITPQNKIPHPQGKFINSQAKVNSQPHIPQIISINLEPEQIQEEKPKLFDWRTFGAFCGVTSKKKISLTGCSCGPERCPHAVKWTEGHKETDKATYLSLKKLRVAQKDEIQIDKDVDRTYGDTPTFGRNPAFKEMLREVLHCFSVYDPEVGYVQGMNLIAANLLFHIKKPEQTFWAFVDLMENQELRLIFSGNMTQLTIHCSNIDTLFRKKMSTLYKHMQQLGINSRCFLDGWLLSLMSKMVPIQDMHLVINDFSKKGWSFIYELIAELLKTLGDCLLLSEDQPQFLMALSSDSCAETGVEWGPLIGRASANTK